MIKKIVHVCLCAIILFCISQFYACSKRNAVIQVNVWMPVTQVWNPAKNRWEVSLAGQVEETNGAECVIERIWCVWSYDFYLGPNVSGLITEREGGRIVMYGKLAFRLEGYIYNERELEVIVFAEWHDANGRKLQVRRDCWSEYIYP